MRQVHTNAELGAIRSVGDGFIFNDFTSGPAAAKNNVLHVASCTWVGRILKRADLTRPPSVPKIFFDTADEAEAWLMNHRGPAGRDWKCCGTCTPNRAVINSDQPRQGGGRKQARPPPTSCSAKLK